jgi:stage IV sporulation protein FB
MIGEPSPTQADLHFRLFGIPVRIHPFFWIVALFLGIGGRSEADPIETLIWVAVVFLSILVHELGHAFLQRRYGGHPWITLYGFGGLASCDDCDRSPRSQILISLAGPAAGFAFAILLLLALQLSGREPRFQAFPGFIGYVIPGFKRFASWPINAAIFDLFQVNIFWGLVNLLPVYPLDGGRISRELFTLGNSRQGIVQSLWVSVISAAAVAGIAVLAIGDIFITLFFGYLAYASYQTLRAYEQSW